MKTIQKILTLTSIALFLGLMFITTPAQAQTLGMVADNGTGSVTVFDADADVVLGSVTIGTSAAFGDCAILPDQSLGFVTDFNSHVWVIDLNTISLAGGTNPIPISNYGEDLVLSPDNQFLLVSDGGGFQPVSVIDIATRTEITTFSLGSDCNSVEVCDDGSVLVTSVNAMQIRRLTIDGTGNLTDTGESMSVSGPNNSYGAPGSASGVVITRFASSIQSFGIPGLGAVDTRSLSGFGISGIINPAGDKVYVRSNFPGAVEVFSLNAATGQLGATPLLAISVGDAFVTYYGMEQMALSPDDSKLYVPEPGALNIYDSNTGTLIYSITDAAIVFPTGVCFANVQPDSYDIYTVNTKTGNVERVTFLDYVDEYNPSFNNNGKLVAHDVVSSSDPLGQSIYITDIQTHTSTPLLGAEGGNDASWSPNGQYIVFDRATAGDAKIYIVPAGGGISTMVRDNAVDAEWSNNSQRLVFLDITDGSLRTVDLSGGSETNLGVYGINASWSNNGKAIVFSDGYNIFTIAVSQAGEPLGDPVQLTFDGTGIYNSQPSWSNDSKTIVFHSNRVTGDFDIWTIAANGGTPTLLTGNPDYGDYDPSYSKDGKYVAYAGFTTLAVLPKGNSNNQESLTSNNSVPTEYVLEQNFPNPFNPTTQIRFSIPEAENVTLNIYNSVGQLVKTLAYGNMSEGHHQVTWDAKDNRGINLSSGIYFYRLQAGSFIETKKMILMK